MHLRVCVCFVCMRHQIRAKSFTYNPRWLEAMQSACLSTPSQLFCVSPPGGASPGWSDPTVDTTVSLQPMPTYWYYVIAGGGAIFLLGCVTLVMVLCWPSLPPGGQEEPALGVLPEHVHGTVHRRRSRGYLRTWGGADANG